MEIQKNTKFKKSILGLNVLEHDYSYKPKIDLSLDNFTKWKDNLPISDVGASAKKIYLALTEINKTSMLSQQRFALAEMLRGPLYQTTMGLKKHYINYCSDFSSQKITIAHLAQTLHSQMINIYKTVLDELSQNKKLTTEEIEIKKTSLYRAIYFSMLVVFRSYQLYSQPDEDIWNDTHIIYLYAKKIKMHQISIGTEFTANKIPMSAENFYKHMLIMSIVNPNQWKQVEQINIYNAAAVWIDLVVLRNFTPEDKGNNNIYLIKSETNINPILITKYEGNIAKDSLVLDVEKLSLHIKRLINEIKFHENKIIMTSDENPEHQLAITTIQRLKNLWCKGTMLSTYNYPKSNNVKICFGLYATHHFISDKKTFNPNRSSEMQIHMDEDSDKSQELAATSTNNHAPTMEGLDIKTPAKLKGRKSLEEKPYTKNICNNCIIKEDGLAIVDHSISHPVISPGDIMAIQYPDTPETWSVGYVAWMKYINKKELHLGLGSICDSASPVAAQVDKKNTQSLLQRCLAFKKDNTNYLITAGMPFKEDDKLWLRDNDDASKTIKLDKETYAISSYKIFSYQEDGEKINNNTNNLVKDPVNTPKKENNDDFSSEFDSIWEEL